MLKKLVASLFGARPAVEPDVQNRDERLEVIGAYGALLEKTTNGLCGKASALPYSPEVIRQAILIELTNTDLEQSLRNSLCTGYIETESFVNDQDCELYNRYMNSIANGQANAVMSIADRARQIGEELLARQNIRLEQLKRMGLL